MDVRHFIESTYKMMYSMLVIFSHHDIQCTTPKTTVFSHGAINTVISKHVKLGEHCIIGQNVTIGKRWDMDVPTIGDYVIISPHSIVIGGIIIGHHSIIGAGSVVLHSIPPYSVAVGNPAHIIKFLKNDDEYWIYRLKKKRE